MQCEQHAHFSNSTIITSSCLPFTKKQLLSSSDSLWQSKRQFWGWLNAVFNKYDDDRVKAVGANRACAEWLLRCGAGVRWSTHSEFLKDYNSLPVGGPRLAIVEVDATDSAIMHIGFEHFRGCRDIQRVVLHNAIYIDDEALRQLQFLRRSLTELQVSTNGNVTAEGLKYLAKLSNLKYLVIYNLPEVKNKEEVEQFLREQLPECTVLFSRPGAEEGGTHQPLPDEKK